MERSGRSPETLARRQRLPDDTFERSGETGQPGGAAAPGRGGEREWEEGASERAGESWRLREALLSAAAARRASAAGALPGQPHALPPRATRAMKHIPVLQGRALEDRVREGAERPQEAQEERQEPARRTNGYKTFRLDLEAPEHGATATNGLRDRTQRLQPVPTPVPARGGSRPFLQVGARTRPGSSGGARAPEVLDARKRGFALGAVAGLPHATSAAFLRPRARYLGVPRHSLPSPACVPASCCAHRQHAPRRRRPRRPQSPPCAPHPPRAPGESSYSGQFHT